MPIADRQFGIRVKPPMSSAGRLAFTLMELILVMGIVVLVAGMVAAKLGGFITSRRTMDAGTKMAALANYARTQSISQACAYRLNFDLATGKYWLTQDDGTGKFVAPNEITPNPNQALASDFSQEFTVPDGVKIGIDLAPQTDGLYITFQPDGTVDPSHITLTDLSGGNTRISCESATESYRVETGAGT